MQRQKSFENEKPTVYLVPTPIGNLSEFTPRAIEILQSVDVIAAEDTRNTMKLLMHFGIKTKCIAHHLHNELESAKGILNLLEQGKNIAIVSDAGYPLVSDPGQILVNMVLENGYHVVSLSGCNAGMNALVASGLSAQPYMFYGFLSSSNGERNKELNTLKAFPHTIIFYEAPHRVKKMLNSCLEVLGNRNMCLARELTKKHEEFIRGTISEIIEIVDECKGEMVIVMEGYTQKEQIVEIKDLKEEIDNYIKEGYSTKEAIKRCAKNNGLSKNDVYNEYHKEKDRD